MPSQLPPLTALRAFDAAARHMSFAQAAEELSVTPAALSFQIKSLEDNLGVALFHRQNRSVELTEVGRRLHPGLSEGFALIRQSWKTASRGQASSPVTISAGPAFTAKWLAPRLLGFAAAHPEVDLRFAASLKLVDLRTADVDLAIRFGFGRDDGMFSEVLLHDIALPVMRPEIAARLRSPEDLLRETLIHNTSLDFLPQPLDWPLWFRAAGVSHGDLRGPVFSQVDHAVDSAIEGAGVALGRTSIVAGHLRTGQLVAPFKLALGSPAHYRIVCRRGEETDPAIRKFRNWIKAECEADAAMVAAFETVYLDPTADEGSA